MSPILADLQWESIHKYGFKLKIPKDWKQSVIGTRKEYNTDIIFKSEEPLEPKLEFLFFNTSEISYDKENNFDEYLDRKNEQYFSIAEIRERKEIVWKNGQNGKAQIYEFNYPESEHKNRYFLACVYRDLTKRPDYEYVVLYSCEKELKDRKSYRESFKSFQIIPMNASQKGKDNEETKPTLSAGWYQIPTDHYLIESDLKDKNYIETVVTVQLKLIRNEYEKEFQKYKKKTSTNSSESSSLSVPKIKIYSEKSNYISNAEPFNPSAKDTESLYAIGKLGESEILIFYNNSKNKTEFFKNLYKECFHQYIHHFLGFTPQAWLNAGFGSYFSQATFERGKCEIKKPFLEKTYLKKFLPLEDFIQLSYEDFNKNREIYLQQSHAFVYFLKESKNPKWKKILQVYFETLLESQNLEDAQKKAFEKDFFPELNADFKKSY